MLFVNVRKKLRDFCLDVSLSVSGGETLVLIGENGAGKSTLLNLISGLTEPDEGEIKLGEKILYSGSKNLSVRSEERKTGHLFQSYALFPHLSVFDNVAFGLRCRGLSKEETEKPVTEQLEAMQISELSSVNVKSLSGGQRQRVALARSLILKPEILLLDEPLSAVDVRMQAEMRCELRQRIRDTDIPCIIVTHTLTDALELGDRVAIIEKGRIIQDGRPEEVFKNPVSYFVARFTGMENMFRGRTECAGDEVRIDIGPVKLYAATELAGDVIAGIRAEEIILSKEPIKTTARNILKGRVYDIQWNGIFSRVVVDTGVMISAIVTRKSMEELNLYTGQELYVVFKVSAVHTFPA